jgi:hypothetical protein
MFDGSRAYDPTIGRFLQPNPKGPDVLGNSYSYYQAVPIPPLARRTGSMFENNLQILQAFQEDGGITQTLSSNAVWERHAPVPIGYHMDSFYQDFSASSDYIKRETQAIAGLSERLMRHYRPQAHVDARGMMSFYDPVLANNPNSITTRSFVNPTVMQSLWSPSRPQSATATIETAMSLLDKSNYRFRFIEAQSWRPNSLSLSNIWIDPRPNLSYTPDVSDWLLKPLRNPLLGLETLQAAEMISEFPKHDAVWWIERALDSSLPSLPDLPPLTVEDWREKWFESDVLGNSVVYDAAWPSLEYPSIPNYGSGTNWNGPEAHIDH